MTKEEKEMNNYYVMLGRLEKLIEWFEMTYKTENLHIHHYMPRIATDPKDGIMKALNAVLCEQARNNKTVEEDRVFFNSEWVEIVTKFNECERPLGEIDKAAIATGFGQECSLLIKNGKKHGIKA